MLTSISEIGLWGDNIVTIFVVDFLVFGEILGNISNLLDGERGGKGERGGGERNKTNIVYHRYMYFRCLQRRLGGWYIDCKGIILGLSLGLSSCCGLRLRPLPLLANSDIFVGIACPAATVRA
jgi:hypothetical protein